jgi:hypothetical protein
MIGQAGGNFYVFAALLCLGEIEWSWFNHFYQNAGLPKLRFLTTATEEAFPIK